MDLVTAPATDEIARRPPWRVALRDDFQVRWYLVRGAVRQRLGQLLNLEHSTQWTPRTLSQRVGHYLGIPERPYARIVMDRQIDAALRLRPYRHMRALEISGDKWASFGFAEYRSVGYPEYDVCATVYEPEGFDLVIAEQVFEHVLWPYRAVKNVWAMLRPGGVFLISTPFLIRRHDVPVDCTRWTELGLKHLLAEGGFALADIETASWGNRACVRAGLQAPGYAIWLPWRHSLHNEQDFPVVVWALATKAVGEQARAIS